VCFKIASVFIAFCGVKPASQRMRQDKLYLGLLAAWATSIIAAFIVGCIYTAFSVRTPSGWPDLALQGAVPAITAIAFVVAMVAMQVSTAATLVLGFPIFKYLVHRGSLSAASSIAAGAVVAAILSGLLFAAHRLKDFLVSDDFNMGMAAIIVSGPVSGLALWLVVRS
jgi:hypothetical protein